MGDVARLLGQQQVLTLDNADVMQVREKSRRKRLATLFFVLFVPTFWLWYRLLDGRPVSPGAPQLSDQLVFYMPMILIAIVIVLTMLVPFLGGGRSPHVTFRPEQIDVTLDDVKGLDGNREEVIRSLNLFLAYRTFRSEMGGNPRRGILFEGPPGTGKTHLAKAMARHAGVPFLFVSGPAFQSMWYGQTARKIRRFFKVLKKTARREGGAIGFIEEIDAIATKRGGLDGATPAMLPTPFGGRVANQSVAQGTGGVVNELLIQMQSFDSPTGLQVALNRAKDWVNVFLPMNRQLRKKGADYSNVLIIAATNRGDMLDPAMLRPGRFDRRLYFDVPSRSGRRELIDYFLTKKSHGPDLDEPRKRDELAAMTFGYSPVMIERLLDEALIWALRNGRDRMHWEDISAAKMSTEIGLPHPVSYTDDERRSIAIHEAGHATVAYLVGEGRKMEILSIIKRREALGLLGHSETEERFTKTRTEMEALLKISLGGMAAEEVFEGESGTGPAGDLAYATQLAAEMVGSLGLGKSLVSYRAVGDGIFDTGLVGRVLGNAETKRQVESILTREKKAARDLLSKNQHLVLALRDALLERDELIGDEITDVLEAAGGKKPRPRSGAGRARPAASTGV